MKQRITAFLVALFCCAIGFAGNIQADNVSLKPEETKDLLISLTSAVSDMVGAQFDVTLPNGFTLETKEGEVYQLSQNQASDMACNVNDLGNGTYRFMLYSNSLKKLNAGELMSLNLKAGNNVALGNYPISIHDVAFSDADGQLTNEDGTIATIKLTNFFPVATNIEMSDTKIISGETAPLSLTLLESIRGCVGIQFDLALPDGFSLEKDATGKEYTISVYQASDMSCNLTAVGNGVYRFMIYSNSLKEFVPGELMNINLKVSEEKPLESYSVSIQDIQLSDISGNVHQDNGASANVKVTKFFKLLYQVDGVDYKSFDIEYGATITPEAEPTKEGYNFSGWSEIPATMPAHDVTITGTFIINKYKLTYIIDGEVYKTYEMEYGATITPEAEPTKEGYTFSGWSTIPTTMPAYDVTITGSFTKGAYKLTYMLDGVVYKTISYDYGDAITPEPAPTKEGYTFSGWSEIPATMPAHDVTVTGTFSINKYKLTYIVDKLTYIVDGVEYKSYDIEYGATITPEVEPTKEGYTFSGWSEIPATMPAHDVTVTGTFTLDTGIEQIMSNANGDVMIFTIDGKRVDNLKKGMNVIRMKDGTTRKVVVK